MRHVNLVPVATGIATASSRSSVGASKGTAAAGAGLIVVALLVAGYFAMANVNKLDANTAQLTADAARLNNEAGVIEAKIAEAGQKTDYASLASTAQQGVLDKLATRVDFARLNQELGYAVPDNEVTLTNFTAASGEGGGGESGVSVTGTATSLEGINRFITRLNAMAALEDVVITEATKVTGGYEFSLQGALASGTGSSADPGSGTTETVGDGGGALELALEPEPGYNSASKPKKKAKPATSLEQLAGDLQKYGSEGSES